MPSVVAYSKHRTPFDLELIVLDYTFGVHLWLLFEGDEEMQSQFKGGGPCIQLPQGISLVQANPPKPFTHGFLQWRMLLWFHLLLRSICFWRDYLSLKLLENKRKQGR